MSLLHFDDHFPAIAAGQSYQGLWLKSFGGGSAGAAGRWVDGFTSTGIPTAGAYSGTAGVATALTSSSDGAMYTGGDVTPATKRLIAGRMWATASAGLGQYWLVDYLLYYPSCVMTGTPTTLDNTVTLPRYTDGKGVMAFPVVQSALGASLTSVTYTYTNSTPTGSRSSGANVTAAASLAAGAVIYTKPFITLQAGDIGIRKIDSYTINSSGTTGTVALVLAKPLVQIPVSVINTLSERDFLTGLPQWPEIKDGACLGFIGSLGSVVANTAMNATLDFVWD